MEQELESFLNSGVNMDYRCPFCNNKRVGFHNRTPENEPIQLTRNIRKQTNALKMFINNTNDLELYLDCIKYLYDIKAKEYRDLESEIDSSDVDDEEEEQLNIDLSELSEEIMSLIHAIGHAEDRKYGWMNQMRRMLTERRQRLIYTELNNYEFIEIGRRANTSLYRYDDTMDNLTVLVPIGNTVSPVQSAATISPPRSPASAATISPATPPATLPPLTLPRTASTQSTNNDFEINFLPSDNNYGDSKEQPEDVDMRRPRRGTRHGTTIKAARTNKGGKRKSLFKKKRTKKKRVGKSPKRTKGKNKKRKTRRGYGGKSPKRRGYGGKSPKRRNK